MDAESAGAATWPYACALGDGRAVWPLAFQQARSPFQRAIRPARRDCGVLLWPRMASRSSCRRLGDRSRMRGYSLVSVAAVTDRVSVIGEVAQTDSHVVNDLSGDADCERDAEN